MFEGTGVALVTPFRNGEVDLQALRRLAARCAEAGCENLVVAGCTGEAATLDIEERKAVVSAVLEQVGGKARVIAGTGTNSTASTIELSRQAQKLGVDAVMLIAPYYNKPTQQGLLEHYRAVSESLNLPIIIYNVPGRTSVEIHPETVARIAEFGNVVALKEAGGSVDRVSRIRALSPIPILCGDDALTLPMLAVGAKGVISVVANVAPAKVRKMLDCWVEGKTEEAMRMHYELLPLARALFVETNPAPAKFALHRLGLIENELRLPLTPVSGASEEVILGALADLGLVD